MEANGRLRTGMRSRPGHQLSQLVLTQPPSGHETIYAKAIEVARLSRRRALAASVPAGGSGHGAVQRLADLPRGLQFLAQSGMARISAADHQQRHQCIVQRNYTHALSTSMHVAQPKDQFRGRWKGRQRDALRLALSIIATEAV